MFHDFLIFQLKNRAVGGYVDADFPDSLRNICLFEGESLGTISHLDTQRSILDHECTQF